MRRDVISNYHGARKCVFGANGLSPTGKSCPGRAQQGNCARHDYQHAIRPASCTTFPKRTPAGALEDACGYSECSTRAKGVFRRTEPQPSDRHRRTKVHRKMQCHHAQKQKEKNNKGAASKCQIWSLGKQKPHSFNQIRIKIQATEHTYVQHLPENPR